MAFFQPNTLWRDAGYYLNAETGEFMPKFVLVLAVSGDADDAIGAVFTSKANGLREDPACDPGPPRAGYFIGTPGGEDLPVPTWIDFSSVRDYEAYKFRSHIASGRVTPHGYALPPPAFCSVLRCLSRSEDLNKRQHRWLGDTIQTLACP